MKVSLNWLKDYLDFDLAAEQVAAILSDLGLPCEGIDYLDDDAVIDLEITSNRGDCLGHIGVARELAAATGTPLRLPTVELDYSDRHATELADVEILEPQLCGRYTARIIEGVKVGPSPGWLVKRLQAVGLRSVNNVVDATNYAMMETGQPPHAFDYAKIDQGKIIVRKAHPGEQIVSIDGSQCLLTPDMLVIADPTGPVAIAGVMGGLHTEVSDTTTSILLEDAYFDPVSVRTTSRKLALPSEAAFRFERIVDIENIDWASQRTAQLITQLAGGKVAKGLIDVYPQKPSPRKVTLRLSRLNKLLGIEVPPEQALRILAALQFQPQRHGDQIACTVPSWRNDIYREVDLIEEVARHYGYDKVPTERKIQIEVVPHDPHHKLAQLIRTHLNACGFYETINVSFIDPATASFFADSSPTSHLAVRDESRKGANLLRRTLISSLLATLKRNLNVGNTPCRIFELADTYIPSSTAGTLPEEKTKLALAADADFRDLRGAVETLLHRLNPQAEIVFSPTELPWAHVAAEILADGKHLGLAGLISPQLQKHFDFDDPPPVVAELDFDCLLALQATLAKAKPIPRFPAIQRDLSIVVDEDIRWAQIVQAIRHAAPPQLERIDFVEIYRGKTIPAGKKSVTLSLKFRDEDGTLTHEAVDGFQQAILQSLQTAVAAQLRTL